MIELSALKEYMDKVQAESDDRYKKHFPGLYNDGRTDKYSFRVGRKYIKIIETHHNGQQMVFCFVDRENGDIYKAETWQRRAEHVRGNINDMLPPLTLMSLYLR